MRHALVLPTALLLTLGACGSETLTGPSAVMGTVWKLDTLQRVGSPVVVITQPDRYTVEFRDIDLAVRADCNICAGPYTIDGSTLQVGSLACTLVACPPGSHSQDFLAVLTAARSHGVTDDVLTIRSSNGELRFER
jgi:heat shock protein HslJ